MTLEDPDRELLAAVHAVTTDAAAASGAHLACRPGCTPCCIGPFPISQLDAWRLRRGLDRLEATDPARAASVRQRVLEAVAVQAPHFPGDASGTFDADAAREESFYEAFHLAPCPALEPAAGTCDLYAWRPIACRTYGPALQIGGQDLPPCRLCFTTAHGCEIDAARRVLDVERFETPLNEAVEQATGRRGMTTVAFALGLPRETVR